MSVSVLIEPAGDRPVAVWCPACERRSALRKMKRVLLHEDLDGRASLLLSDAVMAVETDPNLNAGAVLALSTTLLPSARATD
jgi:hypothetical protein